VDLDDDRTGTASFLKMIRQLKLFTIAASVIVIAFSAELPIQTVPLTWETVDYEVSAAAAAGIPNARFSGQDIVALRIHILDIPLAFSTIISILVGLIAGGAELVCPLLLPVCCHSRHWHPSTAIQARGRYGQRQPLGPQ